VLLAVSAAVLTLAAPTPRFAVYDLQADLAAASHNEFGDLRVWKQRAALAARAPGATLVHCAAGCRFGDGWLAFAKPPALVANDVAAAKAHRVRGPYWAVTLRMTPRGEGVWTAFARLAAERRARRGLPDVLVVVVNGAVLAQPYADQIGSKGTLTVGGLTRSAAAVLVAAA